MEQMDDISFFLENYKNNYVAQGLSNTDENNTLLENAKEKINSVLNSLTIEKERLIGENKKLHNTIEEINREIKKSKKQNSYLEKEKQFLLNSDKGAIEQNKNMIDIDRIYRYKLIMKVGLISTILMFLYINDDILQTIRSGFSKNAK